MRIVLYQPEIAGNFGNILRTAACFDLPISVIEPLGFPLAAKDVRRAAMDYGRAVDLTRHANWQRYARDLPARRILFTTRATQALADFVFRAEDHLVFGSESAGVPDTVHSACDTALKITIDPDARSLNLSNAVAISAWAALHQTT